MGCRMLKWCEDRKPFPESLLASKSATFKLRREVRQVLSCPRSEMPKMLTMLKSMVFERNSCCCSVTAGSALDTNGVVAADSGTGRSVRCKHDSVDRQIAQWY
eukprot:3152014-Rhodomonas_salina.1